MNKQKYKKKINILETIHIIVNKNLKLNKLILGNVLEESKNKPEQSEYKNPVKLQIGEQTNSKSEENTKIQIQTTCTREIPKKLFLATNINTNHMKIKILKTSKKK